MAWLFAIMQSVTPMFQRAAQSRYYSVMRSACEAGIDYAVSSLVEAMEPGALPSPLDDAALGAPYQTTQMPADLVASSGVDVSVEVRNESPVDSKTYLYDSITDPEASGNAVASKNYYRYVTATATYAGLTKTISVILKPMHGVVEPVPGDPQITVTQNTVTTVSNVPYFQWAAFARSNFSMGGNTYTDAYHSVDPDTGLPTPYGVNGNLSLTDGTVGTNATGTLSDNASVGGDMIVTSLPMGSTTDTVATGSSSTTIHDQLIINGQPSGFQGQTSAIPPVAGDNVMAESQGLDPTVVPVQTAQSHEPIVVPDALSPPTTNVSNIGSMKVSGQTRIVFRDGPVQQTGSGADITYYYPPGDYIVSSLSTTGDGTITIDAGVTTPVRLFVQGSNSGGDAISISGNGIVNGTASPALLQVWYDGSKGVKLAGNGDLHAVVYAPKAPVTINGNGSLFGAVLGNTVTMTGNGGLHFDTSLMSGTTDWGVNWVRTRSVTTTEEISTPTTVNSAKVTGLKAVSWQER